MPYVMKYLGAKDNVSRMCYCPPDAPLLLFAHWSFSFAPKHRLPPSHGNASLQMASFLDERRAIKFFILISMLSALRLLHLY